MKKSNIVLSPYKTCINGHSTEKAEDWIYDNTNRRRCRKCVDQENSGKRRKR